MVGFKELLRTTLHHHSEEITGEWQERIVGLMPSWDDARRKSFAQELMTALGIYLLDQKLQAALRQIDQIINTFFSDGAEGASVVIRALLLVRYILLAKMMQSGQDLNSIELFGFLNDLFNAPAVAIFQAHQTSDKANPPPDFFASCRISLNALEFAGIGYLILDRGANIIYWSRNLERLLQKPAKEAVGRRFSDLFSHSALKALNDAVTGALEAGAVQEFSAFPMRFEGGTLTVDAKVEPLHEDGNIVGCSLLFHDVTGQERHQPHTSRYEQYFENILNDAADAIILLNENHRIIMWNKAAHHLFGYTEAEVFGKELTTLAPDQLAVAEMARMDQTVSTEGFVRNQRLRMAARDGRALLVEITRTALRNERNDFIGSSVILRDITQQEQLRRQIFQSEKLSAVGTLAAGIAHEVGTPLTSISALAQILQIKSTSPEFKEKLALIHESIDRIARTVRTLVDFSRPIAEKVEDIYLNNVIEHVIRILKYDKRLKHQEIVKTLQPDLPLVRAGFDQILQVFINICLNAADAMEGKKDGRLEVSTWKKDRTVYASIMDNGCGIPKAHLDHIFEPFFTTK